MGVASGSTNALGLRNLGIPITWTPKVGKIIAQNTLKQIKRVIILHTLGVQVDSNLTLERARFRGSGCIGSSIPLNNGESNGKENGK